MMPAAKLWDEWDPHTRNIAAYMFMIIAAAAIDPALRAAVDCPSARLSPKPSEPSDAALGRSVLMGLTAPTAACSSAAVWLTTFGFPSDTPLATPAIASSVSCLSWPVTGS